MVHPSGTAPIKSEFRLYADNDTSSASLPVADDDAAEGATLAPPRDSRDARDARDGKDRGGRKKHLTKEEKKAQRGQNKARKFGKVKDEMDLCWKVANGMPCEFGEQCRFGHDIPTYIQAKPKDLRIPTSQEVHDSFFEEKKMDLSLDTPEAPTADSSKSGNKYPNVDFGVKCPVYEELGECRYGYKCRFLGGHAEIDSDGVLKTKPADEERKATAAVTEQEMNFVSADVQKALKGRKYPLPITEAYLKEINGPDTNVARAATKASAPLADTQVIVEPEQLGDIEMSAEASLKVAVPVQTETLNTENLVEKRTGSSNPAAHHDAPDAKVRFSEKRKLNWAGKTYLAPLTTVGNLPFRRLCVKYGADITCGEMGLATSFLSGSKEEWSLVRRHPSERTFGVQLAGNKPANLVPTAEAIANEIGSGIDFVDINCGCPIDLVFKSGSGSALLDAPGKLGKILVGMNKALGEIPVTVKLRTGVKDGKNTAHKLMPRLHNEWNAGCITLHGRTREQRYTKLADWTYIKDCVQAVREKEEEEDLTPIPIFGGGDCFSSQDYWEKTESTGVDGVMIGRGALIKPWIFTEIKERREWDISARERLDLIRDFAEFGITHFGSDTTGINATRRYLCEALSFQYRYIPIGLLEHLPGRINDRAPAFRGRNELETLLSSGNSNDWVKLSEMFLGPAPEAWSFTPKHKSNSYESQG